MASFQEMSHAIRDVVVDLAIRSCTRAVRKVCRPTPQNLIEAVAYFLPAPGVSGYQQVSHLLLEPLSAFLRWTGPEVPVTVQFVAMRPKRVTQKLKVFLACRLDAGLRFIQS